MAFVAKEKKAFGKLATEDLIVDFFNRVGASAVWTITPNLKAIGPSTFQLTVENITKTDSGKFIYFDSKLSNPEYAIMNSNNKGIFFIAKDGSINADVQSDGMGLKEGGVKTNLKYEKNKQGTTHSEIEHNSKDSLSHNKIKLKESNKDGVAELTFSIPHSKLKTNLLFPDLNGSQNGNVSTSGFFGGNANIDNQVIISERRIDSLSVPRLFNSLQLKCFVYSCKTTTIFNTTVNGRKIKAPPSMMTTKRWYETRTNLLMHMEQFTSDGKLISVMDLTSVK